MAKDILLVFPLNTIHNESPVSDNAQFDERARCTLYGSCLCPSRRGCQTLLALIAHGLLVTRIVNISCGYWPHTSESVPWHPKCEGKWQVALNTKHSGVLKLKLILAEPHLCVVKVHSRSPYKELPAPLQWEVLFRSWESHACESSRYPFKVHLQRKLGSPEPPLSAHTKPKLPSSTPPPRISRTNEQTNEQTNKQTNKQTNTLI